MRMSLGLGYVLAWIMSIAVVAPASAEPPDDGARRMQRQNRMRHGAEKPLHADMRARMEAHDRRLDELVAMMNAAEGEAKIDAVAAVVNELVAQRRTRRAHLDERWKRQTSKPAKEREEADAP